MDGRIILTQQEMSDILSANKGQRPVTPEPNLEGLPPINAMTNFSGQGVHRVTISMDERESGVPTYTNLKVRSLNTADMLREKYDGSILSTAHAAGGFPVGEVTDDTRVIIDGMETTAQVAATMGYLRKENGVYVEVNKPSQGMFQGLPQNQSQNTPQEVNQTDPSEPVSFLGEEAEAAMESYYKAMGSTVADAFINSVITGKADRGTYEAVAEATGKTPEQVKVEADKAHNMIYAEGMHYMHRLNPDIDPIEVITFTLGNMKSADIQDTLRQHWAGKVSAWKGVLEAYLDYNIPGKTVQKLQAKGWKFYDRDGVPFCSDPHGREIQAEIVFKQRLYLN